MINFQKNAAAEIQGIIDFAAEHANEYPGQEVAFIFVGGETEEGKVDKLLSGINATVPVVVVYCTGRCDTANPEYKLKWKGNITEQEARQIACAHGFIQFCGSSPSESPANGQQEPPGSETPPPPEPSKCYGKICII